MSECVAKLASEAKSDLVTIAPPRGLKTAARKTLDQAKDPKKLVENDFVRRRDSFLRGLTHGDRPP